MVANGLHYNTLRGVDLLMVRPANAVGLLVLVESLVETFGRRQHVRTGRDDPSLDVRELQTESDGLSEELSESSTMPSDAAQCEGKRESGKNRKAGVDGNRTHLAPFQGSHRV